MAGGTPLPAFEHEPLPDSTTHFRLLHITRGKFGQHVECEISAWPIDHPPRYYAISYTWGDPADTTKITINGRSLVVRRNCEYALQQAFTSNASNYYWVDAICIAQKTQEKNHQVGIMGQIYSEAEYVFACVGPHADDSEYLFRMLYKHRPLLESLSMTLFPALYRERGWLYPSLIQPQHSGKLWVRLRSILITSNCQRLYKSFMSFMNRAYFQRTWVLQEQHLASEVSYLCGATVQEGEGLLVLSYNLRHWSGIAELKRLDRCKRYLERDNLSFLYVSDVQGRDRKRSPQMRCLDLACETKEQTLKYVLDDMDKFKCTDPRDRLYGILNLVLWPEQKKPAPDYNRDNFEVALDALHLMSDVALEQMNWTDRLLEMFHVTLADESLRRAIAVRSNLDQKTTTPTHRSSAHFSMINTYWRSMQISNVTASSNDNTAWTWIACEGKDLIHVQVPLDTRVGDWYVEGVRCECNTKRAVCHCGGFSSEGLIIRSSGDEKYFLVGPVFSELLLGHHAFSTHRGFRGYWDSEDCLILAWHRHQLLDYEHTPDRIAEFVNARICAWDGSSYFERV